MHMHKHAIAYVHGRQQQGCVVYVRDGLQICAHTHLIQNGPWISLVELSRKWRRLKQWHNLRFVRLQVSVNGSDVVHMWMQCINVDEVD